MIDKIIIDLKEKFANNSFMPYVEAFIRIAIERNFDEGGRWDGVGSGLFSGGNKKWSPLAASTKKKYAKLGYLLEPTLYRSGYLRNTIEVKSIGARIIITAGGKYSRIHQLGGMTGKNKKTKIPARPYITLTKEDLNEIINIINKIVGLK